MATPRSAPVAAFVTTPPGPLPWTPAGAWGECRILGPAAASLTALLAANWPTQPLVGDRILLAAQASGPANGVYVAGAGGTELNPGGNFPNPAGSPGGIEVVVPNDTLIAWKPGPGSLGATGCTILGPNADGWYTLVSNTLTVGGWVITLTGTQGQPCQDSLRQITLTRAADANASNEFATGKTVRVAGVEYSLTTTGSINLGTTALTFTAIAPSAKTPPIS